MNVTLAVTETPVDSDGHTTVKADVGGEGYNGVSHFTFVVRDGSVARMTIRQ